MTNVTCRLTTKKAGSVPCPTLVIKYGTNLLILHIKSEVSRSTLFKSSSTNSRGQTDTASGETKHITTPHLQVLTMNYDSTAGRTENCKSTSPDRGLKTVVCLSVQRCPRSTVTGVDNRWTACLLCLSHCSG